MGRIVVGCQFVQVRSSKVCIMSLTKDTVTINKSDELLSFLWRNKDIKESWCLAKQWCQNNNADTTCMAHSIWISEMPALPSQNNL